MPVVASCTKLFSGISVLLTALLPIAALIASTAAPTEPLRHDDRGRPMIAVSINGGASYDMVVDTAAQTSLVTEALAQELGLAAGESTMHVVGATGMGDARLYRVKRFASALFDLQNGELVTLPNAGSTSARGIVGMDLFATRRLLFNRSAGNLVAEASGPPTPGFVAVKGQVEGDTMLIVPVSLNGTTVQALIDTGAAVSMVSPAALQAMGWRADDRRLTAGGEIRGATTTATKVRLGTIARLTIGPATLRDVPMLFPGDGAFGVSDGPSMILGADLLNLFEAFAIDWPRQELHVRVPERSAASQP